MCGIIGILDCNDSFDEKNKIKALNSQGRRGPDNFGTFKDEKCWLGHARLSIQDTSENGSQPMCGRQSTIVFNGELYNYQELELKLKKNRKVELASNSDTELIIMFLEVFGPDEFARIAKGMWAIAWYTKNNLILMRDSNGEKPLYYTYDQNKYFAFSSTLKSLFIMLDRTFPLSVEALQMYFSHGYFIPPLSIVEGVRQLMPGEILVVDTKEAAISSIKTLNTNSEKKKTTSLNNIIQEAVERQFVSDVPVGAFLSGGIDSSLVCAVAKNGLGKDFDTFTIGFENPNFDELNQSKIIAKKLGLKTNSLRLSNRDLVDLFITSIDAMDEPISDPSFLPTLAVSKLASQSVKVVLSGDGGDEYFYGYTRYVSRALRMPKLGKLFETELHTEYKALNVLSSSSLGHAYLNYIKVDDSVRLSKYLNNLYKLAPNEIDKRYYLPGNILHKLDKATMYYSIEGRVPLLDKDIKYFAENNPKLNFHKSKKELLRTELNKYIDYNSLSQEKRGFGIPLDNLVDSLVAKNFIRNDSVVFKYSTKTFNELMSSLNSSNGYRLLWNYIVLNNWIISVENWLEEN